MGDLTLFVIGCIVCFIFGGGILIHTIANQKSTEDNEPSNESSQNSEERSSAK